MFCKKIHSVLCLALLVNLFSMGTCYTMKDAKMLLADKQSGYEKTFRPLVNQSAPLALYVGLELLSIQEFDEVQQKLTITAVVALNWVDEYMQWKPSDYGGLKELVIESDKVWTPNLVLVNNVDKLDKIGDAWQLIRFTPNGTATYYPGNVLSASCRADVTYYPWDKHKCAFIFAAWAQGPSEIVFLPSTDKVQTYEFSENGAWTFYNSSVESYNSGFFITFYLYLERKPLFVLVNIIIPVIFMAFLNVMIFAIPVESGERISYSITVLLAITVFLTLVGDNLPKTSSPMSIFSYYVLVVLLISICIVLGTVYSMHVYYKDDNDPIPGWLARFVICLKCKCKKKGYKRKPVYLKSSQENNGLSGENRGTQQNGGSEKDVGNNGDSIESDISVYSRKHTYRPISKHVKLLLDLNSVCGTVDIERNSRQENFATVSAVSWQDVSLTMDKICFVLSLLINIIATVVFCVYIFLCERR